jgi:SAM-dependent methyltransferase
MVADCTWERKWKFEQTRKLSCWFRGRQLLPGAWLKAFFRDGYTVGIASCISACVFRKKKMMGLYDKYILPKVVDWACKQGPSMHQRIKVIPLATGNVLEIGIGSGLNLPLYDSENVKRLTAIDPSKEMWDKNLIDTETLPFDFVFTEAYAEDIPEDNNSFDTVVITYALCTIPDTKKALEEVRRVLKPNGKLIFCEHGKAPDRATQKWQDVINPVWKRLGGGCNLNKDIPLIIESNGFKMSNMEAMYIPGWKPASFNYWGTAKAD